MARGPGPCRPCPGRWARRADRAGGRRAGPGRHGPSALRRPGPNSGALPGSHRGSGLNGRRNRARGFESVRGTISRPGPRSGAWCSVGAGLHKKWRRVAGHHEGRGIWRCGFTGALPGRPKKSVEIGLAMDRPRIAITMGDAAGVGPEIIMKSLAHGAIYERCRPLVVGDASRLRAAGRIVGAQLSVRSVSSDQTEEGYYKAGTIDCVDLHLIPPDLAWGELSPLAGDAAF